MKKKILTVIIGCLMVMSLAACGTNDSKEAKEANPKFEKTLSATQYAFDLIDLYVDLKESVDNK